jgi:hypothetical protein
MAVEWRVYLSGEIHTDWRQEIADGGLLDEHGCDVAPVAAAP